jgi:hypothetical protein
VMQLAVQWAQGRAWPTAQEGETVAATKRLAKYEFVPEALWGKFPNSWILMLEKSMRITGEVTMLLLSFLILYATLVGPPHRSEWIYLLTASLGPGILAVWYIVFPLNPYQSMSAIREGMKDLDQRDQDAKQLVALLRSPEARRFLIERGLKLSLLFVVPMAIISAGLRMTPIWRFSADCMVRIPFFIFVCLFVLFRIELLNWALRSWKATEGSNQAIQ